MIRLHHTLIAMLAAVVMATPGVAAAQQPKKSDPGSAAAAGNIADFFSKVGDQIFEECIYELSQEQLEVQQALIEAYVQQGAPSALARKLAVKQIRPPKLSQECEQIRGLPRAKTPSPPSDVALAPAPAPTPTPAPAKKPEPESLPWAAKQTTPPGAKQQPGPADVARSTAPAMPPATVLATKQVLPQWDCAPGVDYVTIKHNGYPRKLTGGEICNPFEDVVREVPAAVPTFRLGYTIKTGRLFVIADGGGPHNGKTIAWAISGREACRNNPDPDCLAARAIGPLPPGDYTFAADKAQRVSWGPKTKRSVAGIYLTKLANKERYSPAQAAAILARGNIAIHVRLKGEMSEACLGLEPKGWNYVATLIKDQRATGVSVYIDDPYPQLAENPPVIVASTFSLTSLFK